MTTSHSRRCWNTLHMYEADLIWVWIGWGVSIIACSMIQVSYQENLLLLPLWLWAQSYIRFGLSSWPIATIEHTETHYICMKMILMTTSHSRRCWNTIYIYMYDNVLIWVWSGWVVLTITYNMIQVRSEKPSESPSPRSSLIAYIRMELHPYDQWPLLKVMKHLIYIKKTWYEYEVDGMPQPNATEETPNGSWILYT